MPGMTFRGSGVGRPHSRGSTGSLGGQITASLQRSEAVSSEDEMQTEFEATIIEALPQPAGQAAQHSDRQQSTMIVNRGHRVSALEVVEEERTPGTTPSPSGYLPDIHHNQKL